jgi:hypothetical protein
VETAFADTVYGRNRQLTGFDLYLDFNRTLRRRCDVLFDTLPPPKLAVDNSDRNWSAHLAAICRYLELTPAKDPFDSSEYVGEYAEIDGDGRCVISSVDDSLQVEGLFNIVKHLLPKESNTLFVRTWPDELTFARDEAGEVVGFSSTGPWNRIGDRVWQRVSQV